MCFLALLWLERYGLLGPELEFAVFVDFGFGLQAARNFDHVIEYALAHLVDRFRSVDYTTGRKIPIVGHAFEDWSV